MDIVMQDDAISIIPLPLLFKALLHGQKNGIFFFSGHLIYILKQERFRAFKSRALWSVRDGKGLTLTFVLNLGMLLLKDLTEFVQIYCVVMRFEALKQRVLDAPVVLYRWMHHLHHLLSLAVMSSLLSTHLVDGTVLHKCLLVLFTKLNMQLCHLYCYLSATNRFQLYLIHKYSLTKLPVY
jgi:hypothetical protein